MLTGTVNLELSTWWKSANLDWGKGWNTYLEKSLEKKNFEIEISFLHYKDCEADESERFTIAQEIEKLSESFTSMKVQVDSLANEMATMKSSIEATTGIL